MLSLASELAAPPPPAGGAAGQQVFVAAYGVIGVLFTGLFGTVAVGYALASRRPSTGSGAQDGRTPRTVRRLVGARA